MKIMYVSAARPALRLVMALVIAAVSVVTLAGCGPCTENQTRNRGVGRNAVHERCYKKFGDTGPHWYRDDTPPRRPTR
jgi:hypothetical protein